MKAICILCGEPFKFARFQIGYRVCLDCGDEVAHQVRHTVAPLHKSNYVLITNMEDLKGLNNKGGLVK